MRLAIIVRQIASTAGPAPAAVPAGAAVLRSDLRERRQQVALKRHAAGEHLVQHDPQGVNVRGRADGPGLAASLLRRHVRRRAHDDAALRPRGVVAPLALRPAGQAEVHHDDILPLAVHHHVRGLQVAMHHAVQRASASPSTILRTTAADCRSGWCLERVKSLSGRPWIKAIVM